MSDQIIKIHTEQMIEDLRKRFLCQSQAYATCTLGSDPPLRYNFYPYCYHRTVAIGGMGHDNVASENIKIRQFRRSNQSFARNRFN